MNENDRKGEKSVEIQVWFMKISLTIKFSPENLLNSEQGISMWKGKFKSICLV